MHVIIDYYEYSKTFELWDLIKDSKYPCRDFKSIKAAENFCIKNNLTYKFGLSCDG